MEQRVDRDHRLDNGKVSSETGTPGGGTPPEQPRKPNRQWLGDSLRALLKGYAEEPLPAEFKLLLDKLETESKNKNGAEGNESERDDAGDRGNGEGGAPTA